MSLIARMPTHVCRCFPPHPMLGDIVRCEECGQHWHRTAWEMGRFWDDVSPRQVKRLLRKYDRRRANIERKLAGGPYTMGETQTQKKEKDS